MNSPSLPMPPSPPAAGQLPPWNQLPRDRRHELTATLAAMILKQLPPRPSAPREISNERP
jgi:hypothetical protein